MKGALERSNKSYHDIFFSSLFQRLIGAAFGMFISFLNVHVTSSTETGLFSSLYVSCHYSGTRGLRYRYLRRRKEAIRSCCLAILYEDLSPSKTGWEYVVNELRFVACPGNHRMLFFKRMLSHKMRNSFLIEEKLLSLACLY